MEFKPTSSQLIFYTKNYALDSNIWNQSLVQVFPKVYSYEQLNDAYNFLKRDHEGLRVRFKETDEGLVSYVEEYKHTNFPFIKVGSIEEMLEEEKKFVTAPMDFYGTLVNPIIFQTPTHSGVMIAAHHIAIDGYCSYILSKDINQYLKDPTYCAATQTYAEYVEREEKHKHSKRFLSDREFWKNQFSTNPECNILPNKNTHFDVTSKDLSKDIPAKFLERVKAFCTDNEIAPASFFNTVYAEYLRRTYNAENFTIGVPVLNRTTRAELNTIGPYMHIVPMVINLQPGSFTENAKKIEDSWLNIFRHQKFTQYDIKQMLHEENKSINTLYDVTSDFLEFIPNDDYEIILPYGNDSTIPLEFHFQNFNEGQCKLRICYQKAHFTETEIRIMFDSIVTLMESAIETPFENINNLEMLSKEEKQKVLVNFNNTKADYEKEKCIHELFEAQVERTPDKTALVATDKTVTYKELNEEANKIANALIEKGIGKGDIVGLMLPRKSYLLSALFGVLKTGAAYLPIDSELPTERIDYMCKDTNARFVISPDNIDALLSFDNSSNPNVEMSNDSLCYCIYTSGSTGQPKGVMAKHRNVVNYISKNEHNIFGKIITDDFEAIVSISTCSFDIFVTETIATLVNGLRVVLADEQECRNQYALNELLTREKGEFLQTTPTKLKALTAEPSQREFLKNVKAILLGGEAMEFSYLNELKALTNAKIYNIYGVTEVPIWSAFVDTDTFTDTITIGHGIANTQMYVVDKYLNPVPIGVTGELCIAGDSVSSGYLNQPELTEEKFVDNPFGEGKLYKTGDHAYWREDGNLVFIGRKDFQVKIRGLRIELGEIESAIQAIEEIERAVVIVRKDNEDRQLLCAFYTGIEINPKDFRAILSSKLPKYMVPHIFTHLEKMPMTASGKANRNALPEIDLTNIGAETEYVAPTTEKEVILTKAIENVLRIEKVSILDNFFDLGGDSLKSIELVSEIEDKGYT
ncbi:MAG: amino acid adenylation domain-containing protein, partial [Clostridia bacterium]|nr:amino acid adenylation domain-containing protein [Clostridia bacterium]